LYNEQGEDLGVYNLSVDDEEVTLDTIPARIYSLDEFRDVRLIGSRHVVFRDTGGKTLIEGKAIVPSLDVEYFVTNFNNSILNYIDEKKEQARENEIKESIKGINSMTAQVYKSKRLSWDTIVPEGEPFLLNISESGVTGGERDICYSWKELTRADAGDSLGPVRLDFDFERHTLLGVILAYIDGETEQNHPNTLRLAEEMAVLSKRFISQSRR